LGLRTIALVESSDFFSAEKEKFVSGGLVRAKTKSQSPFSVFVSVLSDASLSVVLCPSFFYFEEKW